MNDEGVSGSHAVGIEGGLAALEDQLDFPSFLMDRCGFIKGKLPVAGNEKQFSSTFDRPVAVVWDEEIIR